MPPPIPRLSGDDRRATALKLTARGERALAEGFRAWQRAHEALAGAYGERRLESLLEQTRELGRSVKALAR